MTICRFSPLPIGTCRHPIRVILRFLLNYSDVRWRWFSKGTLPKRWPNTFGKKACWKKTIMIHSCVWQICPNKSFTILYVPATDLSPPALGRTFPREWRWCSTNSHSDRWNFQVGATQRRDVEAVVELHEEKGMNIYEKTYIYIYMYKKCLNMWLV